MRFTLSARFSRTLVFPLLLGCSSGGEDSQSGETATTSLGGVESTATVSSTGMNGTAVTASSGGVTTTTVGGTVAGSVTTGAVNTVGGPDTTVTSVGGAGMDSTASSGGSGGGAQGTTGGGGEGGSSSATVGGSGGSGGSSTSSGGSGSSVGGTGSEVEGEIAIDDPVPGFASVSGGTNGGGSDLATAVTVDSMSDLASAASGSGAAIILVEPGDYAGSLSIGSNKTIIGLAPGVKITGNVSISGSSTSNVIVRNIAVQGEPCASYDECRAGADAVYVGDGAHHVWLDHMDISDGQDGNCDVTQEGDFVTVSWSKFYYTYDKEHRYSNLIAGSDGETNSRGKLNITYMNSEWGDRVDSRQPRGRFGNIHMLNNYHHTGGGQIHGVGFEMALIAEQSVYEENGSIWTDMGSPRGWQGIGNIGSASDLNDSQGTVFEIPYDYTALPASEVKAAVTSPTCGAGNTCTLRR